MTLKGGSVFPVARKPRAGEKERTSKSFIRECVPRRPEENRRQEKPPPALVCAVRAQSQADATLACKAPRSQPWQDGRPASSFLFRRSACIRAGYGSELGRRLVTGPTARSAARPPATAALFRMPALPPLPPCKPGRLSTGP